MLKCVTEKTRASITYGMCDQRSATKAHLESWNANRRSAVLRARAWSSAMASIADGSEVSCAWSRRISGWGALTNPSPAQRVLLNGHPCVAGPAEQKLMLISWGECNPPPSVS